MCSMVLQSNIQVYHWIYIKLTIYIHRQQKNKRPQKISRVLNIQIRLSIFQPNQIFQPMIVDAELRLHETVVLKILHWIYIKLNIALQ